MRHITVTVTLLLFAAGIVFAGGNGEAAPEVPLRDGFSRAQAGGVDVQWRVDGDELEVQMSAPTTGWVAVGFDPTRMMADANMIIGYVSGGAATVSDDYGTGNTRHGRDTANGGTDDIIRAEGTETELGTQIRFTIPLDSGDSTDRPLVPGQTYKVIVAYGSDGADNFTGIHRSRGSFEMEL